MVNKWYRNSLVIVASLILFFPVGLIWMWALGSWSKKAKIVVSSIFAILFVIGMASSSSKPSAPATSPTATSSPQPTAKVVAEPTSISDKLWIALDRSMKTRDGFSVEYDEPSKTASIIKTDKDFWDENSVVRESFTALVKFGMEAFKVEGVEAVRVVTKTEFTDQYGKKDIGDAVRIIMNKSEFSKFDWNNLKYQSVYNQIKNASESFYIHPAILKNLKTDKLYLTI